MYHNKRLFTSQIENINSKELYDTMDKNIKNEELVKYFEDILQEITDIKEQYSILLKIANTEKQKSILHEEMLIKLAFCEEDLEICININNINIENDRKDKEILDWIDDVIHCMT